MTIRFVELAEVELDEAIHYYEGESTGLGAEFLDEVISALNRIAEFPEAWQQLEFGVRRSRLNRFPYGLVYSRSRGDIIVLGVAHLRRKPENWRDRLNKDTP